MRIKILRIILLILIICTMFIIFGFSSQNATESKGISTKISEYVLKFNKTYQQANQKEKASILKKTNAIMRKVAHFSIYTVLGILLTGAMMHTKLNDKKRILITICIGLLYAISDEIHQSFSPGRTPLVTDVYIDMLGVIIGALLVVLVKKIYNQYITKILQKKI